MPEAPPARATPPVDPAVYAPSGTKGRKQPDGTRSYVPKARVRPDPAQPLAEVLRLIRALRDGPTLDGAEAVAMILAARYRDLQPRTLKHYRRAALALTADRLEGLVRDLEDADDIDEPAKVLSKWLAEAMKRPATGDQVERRAEGSDSS